MMAMSGRLQPSICKRIKKPKGELNLLMEGLMTSPANTNTADPTAATNNSVNNTSGKATDTRGHDIKHGAILILADIVVALLLLAGVLSLYEGLGINFRILEYPDLRAYGIPIGLLLVGLALATARFWVFRLDPRGSDLRPVGAPPNTPHTPPGPRHGMMPLRGFVPRGTSAANENRAPDNAASSRALHTIEGARNDKRAG